MIKMADFIDKGEASLQTGPFGTQFKASEYVDSGIPVINVKNIGVGNIRNDDLDFINERTADRLRAHRLKAGDIVFGRKGAADRHALIRKESEGWVQGSDCMRLRLESKRLDVRFLSYFFYTSGHKYWMEAVCAFGATMTTLNHGIVRRIELPLPPRKVQEKIAAILSAYDELIENNRQRIALLEKLAEEIYREWFVRLRFPGHEKEHIVKGVPSGWKDQKFGQFCQLQRGYDLPDADVEPGPYPVIASTSIKAYHSQFKVEPPVITTGRSGSLGEVLFVDMKAWPHNTALYVKQFFGNSPFLVYYTLKSMRLENFNSGAGVPTLNRNHLNGIPMIVPDKPLQDRFDDIVSKLHSQVELLEKVNASLTATRDKLLPRLISGKLSVENLDIQFPPGMVEELSAEPAVTAAERRD
jgi:type I restriction enzyme S subunit